MMYLEAIESSHLSRDILDDIPAKYVDGAVICEELNTMAKEHEKNPMIMPGRGLKGCISKDLLCEHKEDSGVTHFALGLCEACYKIEAENLVHRASTVFQFNSKYDYLPKHDFQTYFASLTGCENKTTIGTSKPYPGAMKGTMHKPQTNLGAD
ncbi:hypothetical protein JHK85_007068 [Glycine max]|nr:hypothetical protein JHK85_007068 [Glycine max]